jgi:hypothetical protein
MAQSGGGNASNLRQLLGEQWKCMDGRPRLPSTRMLLMRGRLPRLLAVPRRVGMPQREFATQRELIDYAEQNSLVYVWAFGHRHGQLLSPVTAFTKTPAAALARSVRGLWMCAHLVVSGARCYSRRRSCKRSLRPTISYARCRRLNESACGRTGWTSSVLFRKLKERIGAVDAPKRKGCRMSTSPLRSPEPP